MNNDRETVMKATEDMAEVRTVKGAEFKGIVSGWYYNGYLKHYGVVVESTVKHMMGLIHVYPAAQVEIIDED